MVVHASRNTETARARKKKLMSEAKMPISHTRFLHTTRKDRAPEKSDEHRSFREQLTVTPDPLDSILERTTPPRTKTLSAGNYPRVQ